MKQKIFVLFISIVVSLSLCSCREAANETTENSEQIPDTSSVAFESQENDFLEEILVPVKARPGTYQTISTDGDSYFVVKNDDTLWAWGENTSGQLGIGTETDKGNSFQREPVLVMENVMAISTLGDGHGAHTLILKTDGTLWGAGTNRCGELGIGAADREIRAAPIYIMDDVASVYAGPGNSFAIKSDHSLWAWGDNGLGTLGNGTTEPQFFPVKVLDGVESVDVGPFCTFAVKTDGTLWVWGSSHYGAIAEESTVPVQIMENVAAVCVGNGYYGVIKTDGTLWAWGKLVNYNDPLTPVYILDDVAAISPAGNYGFYALKNDGTLWRCDESSPEYYSNDKKCHVWDGVKEPEGQLNDLAAIDGDGNAVWMIVKSDGTLLDWRNPLEYTPVIDNIKIS